ncbi:hypothetical protein L915_08890 [Phytophthora nicotianae]|uniref:Uncharacterized protein n=1 Tax=Phytophthora nicotianae TaxID=4792 RepID=W2GU13_PHYNI|nr:hypothetical protein L915_08890 [Phytophthora nicotianae]ETM46318.1 hypothetical protein L914_08763 [Phytophthora nicotianae]
MICSVPSKDILEDSFSRTRGLMASTLRSDRDTLEAVTVSSTGCRRSRTGRRLACVRTATTRRIGISVATRLR